MIEKMSSAQVKKRHLFKFYKTVKNPMILIVITVTSISGATGDLIDSLIILAIILGSVILSFFQESNASNVMEELRSHIQTKSIVLRDGRRMEISARPLTTGDVVILTGESFGAEKTGLIPPSANLAERSICQTTRKASAGNRV